MSVCVFLLADLDSPRGAAIHVTPQNLLSLSQSLLSTLLFLPGLEAAAQPPEKPKTSA